MIVPLKSSSETYINWQRCNQQIADAVMVPPAMLVGNRYGDHSAIYATYDGYLGMLMNKFQGEMERIVKSQVDAFWKAEMRERHKRDMAGQLHRWANAVRAGRKPEMAEFVWSLVFAHPEAEWTARLGILADYLRDNAGDEPVYQAGELLGELLSDGFTLEVTP